MSVSHSHRRTKRRWNPNVQRVRVLVNGAPRRMYVCTGCIKAGKVDKAARGMRSTKVAKVG
jgi:large subunit ribosomal protein L28